ncbi:MAG TPA: ATP-binding protein [Acetobacteraceae bacterium]|nr:ATP-binding protein [Acetobacteraceae bacterium]
MNFSSATDPTSTISESSARFPADRGIMGGHIRETDWSATPLGPIDGWSSNLRMMVNFLLANRFPLLLWWGPQYISIYNDAYAPILGNKHPAALGQPVSECWAEIWHILKPLIDNPFHGGPATWMEDLQVDINRRGFVEETHFTVAYSPVPDEAATRGIGGVLATVHEITEKVIGERRVQVLRELGARAAESRTAEAACATAAEMLARHAKDIPWALLYLLEDDGSHATLAAAAGIAAGEAANPASIDLAVEEAPWPLAQVIRDEAPVVVADPRSGSAKRAVMLPIRSNKPHQFAGVLVAGVSQHIELDQLYLSFLELVAAQIATAIANARSYEEERRKADALAEIDRAKTAFFSNVSHEFRTPLALMLGPLEQMLADPESSMPEGQRRDLAVVHRNSLRLLRLVNALLDFSRIEAGRAQARYRPTDLAALTADIVSGFRSATQKAGLTLDVDCEPLPAPVFVDHDMWEKVVLNLLSNAFKFTFDGGITVSLRDTAEGAALSVRDTGVGIAEHELPRLFERFRRIEGQRSRSFEGSGIGLALVQELVRLHGGRIEAHSEPERGTEFIVTLPFGSVHLDPASLGPATAEATTATGVEAFVQEALRWLPDATGEGPLPAADPEGSQSSVLVADDNADMRDYVARLLGRRYRVTTVRSGEAALADIGRQRPDLVVADVMMPGMDGFGLLHAIRSDADLHDLPVIMLSARAGEEASADGLLAGANDYLVKPFSARELLASVDGNLKLAEQRRRARAELQMSERRFRALVTASAEVVYRMSADWSEMRLIAGRGFTQDGGDATRDWLEVYVHADDRSRVVAAALEAVRSKHIFELEHRVRRADGPPGWVFSRAVPLLDAQGTILEWFGMASDITQRKQSEERLQVLNEHLEARVTEEVTARARVQARLAQAQRMEALGQLAGGIAHDFNNVLQAVSGGLNLIQKRADDPAAVRRFAHMSAEAADRGAAVTGRLLAFARRGELRAVSVEPRPLLENLSEILRATLGADITVEIGVPEGAPPLLADKAQLETVLVNLAVNARDAMPTGGTLTVTATPEQVDASRPHPAGIQPGTYLRFELEDTGSGMDAATLARASEPFFTTKTAGQGTGLGLAMARGFAEQSGGGFEIRSTPRAGPTVTLWFPVAVTAAADSASHADEIRKLSPAVARALVVDDDAMVREVLAWQLAALGCRVTQASDGLAALARIDAGEHVDLLVTDYSMPGMNGLMLIEEARRRQPTLPALLLTGYADAHIRDSVIADDELTALLRKPVSDRELADRASAVMNRQAVT